MAMFSKETHKGKEQTVGQCLVKYYHSIFCSKAFWRRRKRATKTNNGSKLRIHCMDGSLETMQSYFLHFFSYSLPLSYPHNVHLFFCLTTVSSVDKYVRELTFDCFISSTRNWKAPCFLVRPRWHCSRAQYPQFRCVTQASFHRDESSAARRAIFVSR